MKKIRYYYHLFASFYYAKRNIPSFARTHLDKMYLPLKGEIDFLSAYNARILMMEGRHREAKDCLRLIIQEVSDSSDSDMIYIQKFCQFHLSLYEGDRMALVIKEEAINLSTTQSVRNFLPFFSDESIHKILTSHEELR